MYSDSPVKAHLKNPAGAPVGAGEAAFGKVKDMLDVGGAPDRGDEPSFAAAVCVRCVVEDLEVRDDWVEARSPASKDSLMPPNAEAVPFVVNMRSRSGCGTVLLTDAPLISGLTSTIGKLPGRGSASIMIGPLASEACARYPFEPGFVPPCVSLAIFMPLIRF